MISIARPMTGVSMKLSTRPRSEAVLGLEPETSYINIQMGSCDPRSRKNTETCNSSMDAGLYLLPDAFLRARGWQLHRDSFSL